MLHKIPIPPFAISHLRSVRDHEHKSPRYLYITLHRSTIAGGVPIADWRTGTLRKILFESDCRLGGHVATRPARVVSGAVYEIRPTRWTVVRGDRFTSGNVHCAATLHTCIRDDGRAVRTDAEVVNREFTQGFELFIEEILVDDCLAVLAWFHDDAYYTS